MSNPSFLPPTRLISFQQRVEEIDPTFQRLKQRPWIYEFSNGRRFVLPANNYTYGYGINLEGDESNSSFLLTEGNDTIIDKEG